MNSVLYTQGKCYNQAYSSHFTGIKNAGQRLRVPQLNHSLVPSPSPAEMLKPTKKKSLTFLKKYGTFLNLDLTTNHTRSKLKNSKRLKKKKQTKKTLAANLLFPVSDKLTSCYSVQLCNVRVE